MLPMLESDARGVVEVFRGTASRVVAVSSMDVYRNFGCLLGLEPGVPDEVDYTEDGPLRTRLYPYRGSERRGADDPNAWRDDYDKIPVEQIYLGQPDLPGTVLRLPVVYGPRDGQRRLYPYLKRMDDGRPAILLDESAAHWRWTRGYMENMAAAIVLAVTDARAAGRVYNVGEPDSLSTYELIQAVAAIVGWKGQVFTASGDRLPEYLRVQGPARLDIRCDSSRIRTELGYREMLSREEGLLRTIAWDRTNPPANLNLAHFNYPEEDKALSLI